MNWLKQNVWEIERSPLLAYIGAILAFLHGLNYYFWKKHELLGPHAKAALFCWNFAPHCGVNGAHGIQLLLFHLYFAVSALAFVVFITRRLTGFAWTMLLLSFLLMLYFYIGNASLATDIHALLIVVTIGYLFFPSKAALLRWSTLFFFFIAGFRELNADWLSGKSLQSQMHITIKGLEWVAALGILFKWALPILLLSTAPQQFAIGVVALIAFLAAHYWYLRDYESVVLALFVFVFVLDYFDRKRLDRESMYQSYTHPEPSKVWWPVLFAMFVIAQTHFANRISPAELLRVKGPAASVDCLQFNFAKFGNRVEQLETPHSADRSDPFYCRQKMAEARVRSLCGDLNKKAGFEELSTYLLVRSITDTEYRLAWHSENICEGSHR